MWLFVILIFSLVMSVFKDIFPIKKIELFFLLLIFYRTALFTYHTIDRLKVYNLVFLKIFKDLCNHHHSQF